MYNPTFGEIKTMIQQELDLQDETFITPKEILNYINEGVKMVESTIHTIYEDYFLTQGNVSFVSNQATYSLPSNIYANKIRQLWYNDNNALNYEIRKVRQLKEIQSVRYPDLYKYMITNDAVAGFKINFYPTPQENSSNCIIWYIRTAKQYEDNNDVCDIPEFANVVIQYGRWKCMSKEGHPDTDAAERDLIAMKQIMIDSLTARIPDEHNEVIQDVSFYEDFDNYFEGGW